MEVVRTVPNRTRGMNPLKTTIEEVDLVSRALNMEDHSIHSILVEISKLYYWHSVDESILDSFAANVDKKVVFQYMLQVYPYKEGGIVVLKREDYIQALSERLFSRNSRKWHIEYATNENDTLHLFMDRHGFLASGVLPNKPQRAILPQMLGNLEG